MKDVLAYKGFNFNLIFAVIFFLLVNLFSCNFNDIPIGKAFAGTFKDDFSSGKLSNWKIYNYQPGLESWKVMGGEAIGSIFQPGFMSLLMTGSKSWTNYTVKCKVKLVKFGKQEDQRTDFGISVYDLSDENTRYQFSIGIDTNGSLAKFNNGLTEALKLDFMNIKTNVWYNFKVGVSSNENVGKMEFWINDMFYTFTDKQPLKNGRVALVVTNAEVKFDDIVVIGDNIFGSDTFISELQPVEMDKKLSTVWGKLKGLY